ncbi:hypothetical protein AFK63_06215 [Cronobacter muytjensii ATCC 51329]|nr:hypothetical protein AFK63_06215 [Cronobacter muytjensii ATCC 51329]
MLHRMVIPTGSVVGMAQVARTWNVRYSACATMNRVSRPQDGAADEKRDSVLNLEHDSHERNKMAAPPWVVPGTP